MAESKKLPGEGLAVVLFWLGWVFIVIPVLRSSFFFVNVLGHHLVRQYDLGNLIELLLSPEHFLATSKHMLITALLMFAGSAFLKLTVRLVKSTEQTQAAIEQLRNEKNQNQ